ncbi:MAG TPA: hypothetical protein VGC07_09720 [Granulicella sp.]
MNIRKLLLALASAVFAVSTAHAQIGAFGTVTVHHMYNVPYQEGNQTFTNGNYNPVGATGGIFYDWRSFGLVRLGGEIRGSITNSTQSAYPNYNGGGGHLGEGLGGVRLSFHAPILKIRPYVSGMVGVARTNFGVAYNNVLATTPGGISKDTGVQITTHFAYNVFAGVDYQLIPIMDWRVVELGWGGVQGKQFNNPTATGPDHMFPVGSISTGVVFHFPRLPLISK